MLYYYITYHHILYYAVGGRGTFVWATGGPLLGLEGRHRQGAGHEPVGE